MNFKTIILGMSILMLSGCATLEQMHQQWVKENCNPSAAFSAGVADGLNPGKSPKNYADSCPDNQSALNDSYMNGFTQGLQKRPQQININNNVTVNKQTVKSHATPYNYHALSDQVKRDNEAMNLRSAQVKADAQKAMDAIHKTQQSY